MKGSFLLIAALAAGIGVAAPVANASGKMVEIGTHAAWNVAPWLGASANSIRFQCLWFKSDINYAGYINEIHWNRGSFTTSGTYKDVRVWLAHTTKTALEATFDNNYTGKMPVLIMNKASWQIPAGPGWVNFGTDTNKFNYNNSDNLLMEIRWNGDGGVNDACSRSGQARRRVYAYDHRATTGTVSITGQCIRLYINTMTGVAPTSLGRVKTLFR
jgi:hypothetical protein